MTSFIFRHLNRYLIPSLHTNLISTSCRIIIQQSYSYTLNTPWRMEFLPARTFTSVPRSTSKGTKVNSETFMGYDNSVHPPSYCQVIINNLSLVNILISVLFKDLMRLCTIKAV